MLAAKQKHQLKAQAHNLKPVILLGAQGLTAAVHNEIERALTDHELIKIRIPGEDRIERRQLAETICHTHQAELIQIVGHVSTVYRKNSQAK